MALDIPSIREGFGEKGTELMMTRLGRKDGEREEGMSGQRAGGVDRQTERVVEQ